MDIGGEKAMSEFTCEKCLYWVKTYGLSYGVVWGICRRYPQALQKDIAEWCGEFEGEPEEEAEDSIKRGLSQKATIDRGSFAQYVDRDKLLHERNLQNIPEEP